MEQPVRVAMNPEIFLHIRRWKTSGVFHGTPDGRGRCRNS
jgi:hypothetical protein